MFLCPLVFLSLKFDIYSQFLWVFCLRSFYLNVRTYKEKLYNNKLFLWIPLIIYETLYLYTQNFSYVKMYLLASIINSIICIERNPCNKSLIRLVIKGGESMIDINFYCITIYRSLMINLFKKKIYQRQFSMLDPLKQ